MINWQAVLNDFSNTLFLSFVVGIPFYGYLRKVKVYDVFVEGAKDGFQTVIKIIPFLVGMLVAIGMFRASGAIDLLTHFAGNTLNKLHIPPDVLPLILIRPFSGGAANGVLADIIHTHGGNSYVSHLAASIMGSTETTFYVLAVYFGVVGIRRSRHAVIAGLTADVTGVIAAVWICRLVFG